MADKDTLRAIFEKHGLDPFDAFLLNEADWPEEARQLVAADRLAMKADANRLGEANRANREAGERHDRWEEQ